MCGVRREREQKFNWLSLGRWPMKRCRLDRDSERFDGLGVMSIGISLIRILTVDDHPLLRKGIAALVNAEEDMKLVAEASSGEEAIEKFRAHRPDVTLMDLQLPGLSGIETIGEIQKEFPNTKIIILTTYSGDAQVVRAIRAG